MPNPTVTIAVYRCPACGGSDAHPDESRSAADFTYMQCDGCGHGKLVDSWQRDDDWLVVIPLKPEPEPPQR